MTSFVFLFDALPLEVFTRIASFVTGTDLLSLSHVNSALLNELLEPDSDLWQQCQPARETSSGASAKQSYFTRRPVSFPGRDDDAEGLKERGGAIAIPCTVSTKCRTRSFSISLWFAMEPSPGNGYAGGILLGAQSVRWSEPWWADNHKQFIQVDIRGNLYCTVTDAKEIVASGLENGRWYHLVLTYDHEMQMQLVYLDGELVHSDRGTLNREWPWLSHWQIGSGCLSGGGHEKPTPGFCGWYGFRGLVDDFMVCARVLQPEEIDLVKAGVNAQKNGDEGDGVCWSLRQAQRDISAKLRGGAKRVGFVPRF